MSNDPRDLDGQKLKQALLNLGRHPGLRHELIDWLKKAENPHWATAALCVTM